MAPLGKLKSILNKTFKQEDGEEYSIQLLSAMTDNEIENFKNKLPKKHLPRDIIELLKFSRGFEIPILEQIDFIAFDQFGFGELLPNSIQLAGDGTGNFWVLDIDSDGNWGSVYYVCHDPAVIIKHSNNLVEFIEDVLEYCKNGSNSKLDIIHEKIVYDIWNEKIGIIEQNKKDNYDFGQIQLPEFFLIADLTDKPVMTGFPWGKFGADTKIIRPNDNPIWVIEKKIKLGFLSRLFNLKKASN